MIVDSSVLVAIALKEANVRRLLTELRDAETLRISAANLLETYIVIDGRRGVHAAEVIEQSVTPLGLIIEPVTRDQVEIARDAYRRYGKGSGHPAQLNFGDCFAYALARFMGEPLLFVGNDFAQTDVVRVL